MKASLQNFLNFSAEPGHFPQKSKYFSAKFSEIWVGSEAGCETAWHHENSSGGVPHSVMCPCLYGAVSLSNKQQLRDSKQNDEAIMQCSLRHSVRFLNNFGKHI